MTQYEMPLKNDFFNNIVDKKKKSLIIKHNKDYQVGDRILLEERTHDNNPTGRNADIEITHIHIGIGLKEGYIDLSIEVWEVMENAEKEN